VQIGLRDILENATLAAASASVEYAAFALTRVRAFEHTLRAPPRPARRPPITVLKPVHGPEPKLEENLRSFCEQDYPEYDVVLGVQHADDPALPPLRRLADEHPERVTVVVGDAANRTARRFRNPKIANLATMLAHARGEILVISDSDMRVGPGYLDAIAEAFDDPSVGAATAIYRGEPAGDDLASALGAMWITEQFAPSAIVAAALEPLAHTFGATMAVRREVLEEIGGLAALGDRLADDHALGRLVTEHGHRVALARCVVTNVVSEPGLRALLRHELRWARTIRTVRRAGYLGIILTYPVPLALLHLALARRRRSAIAVLALAALARIALGRTAQRTFAAAAPPPAWLIPLRDVLGVTVWALGLRGGRVRWRDDALHVDAHGALRADSEAETR